MKILVVEPKKAPYTKEIGNDIDSMQKEVDGFIECVYFFDDPITIICNEEGKIRGLPLNRALRDGSGDVLDVIAGTFFVCGQDNDNGEFCDISDEMLEKYTEYFKTPEQFIRIGYKIITVPVREEVK